MELEALEEAIENYVRPQTPPLGFKLLKKEDELPERVWNAEDLTICQAYNLARHYGWTVFFDRTTSCPIGLVAYGLSDPDELYEGGELAHAAGYAASKEVGKEFEEAVEKLNSGEYVGGLVAPLSGAEFVPDFVAIWGSPAQILRLVHASLYEEGGALDARVLGRAACSEYLEAHTQGGPRLVVPCYGERLFGLTQDHEISFSFPFEMAGEIASNLEETHKGGIRYPVPYPALRTEVPLPESYRRSAESMKERAE